jgi:ubiquinone biosynthesis UbiH/UbiF/VisC/COQ6 family hydroxylase
MKRSCEFVVVGGGPIGAAAALGLRQAGRQVLWVGRGAPLQSASQSLDLRVFAISGRSAKLLNQLRVWQAMDASRKAPVYTMQIHPQGGSLAQPLVLDAYEGEREALAWIIEGQVLLATLSSAYLMSGGVFIDGEVSAMHWDAQRARQTLRLADGTEIEAGAVIAADGVHSTMRRLAGLSCESLAYGKTALVEHFACSKPHLDTAYQWFGPHGVLALLPLPGQRVSMVWSAPAALAAELQSLDPAARAQRVQQQSALALGELVSISELGTWPLALLRVPTTSGPGVLLVGDAAHAVHPLAGQGMNLGFGDVQALLDAVLARPPSAHHVIPWGDAGFLASIARSRVEPVATMQWVCDQLSRLFDAPSLQSAPLEALQRLVVQSGWAAFSRVPALRKALIGAAD